jgi:hypothetical protein
MYSLCFIGTERFSYRKDVQEKLYHSCRQETLSAKLDIVYPAL